MDPLTITIITTIATGITMKVLEKTGENIGEGLWDKTSKFLKSLKKESSKTELAISKAVDGEIDYSKTVSELKKIASSNDDFKKVVDELVIAVSENEDEKVKSSINERIKEIQLALNIEDNSNTIINIEKAVNVVRGVQNIETQNIHF